MTYKAVFTDKYDLTIKGLLVAYRKKTIPTTFFGHISHRY